MRFRRAKLPRSRRADGLVVHHVLVLLLLIGYLLAWPTEDAVAGEPRPPIPLAAGVTDIPYHDPSGRPGVQRDYYTVEDNQFIGANPLRWVLLILIGGLAFALGYLYGSGRPKSPALDWPKIEAAIKGAFDETVTEAKIWLKPEVVNDLEKILNKARGTVAAAVKKVLGP